MVQVGDPFSFRESSIGFKVFLLIGGSGFGQPGCLEFEIDGEIEVGAIRIDVQEEDGIQSGFGGITFSEGHLAVFAVPFMEIWTGQVAASIAEVAVVIHENSR
jgi:hypothetical protein